MNPVELESASIEPLSVTLDATADPTGDSVEFVVTASATDPSGTWVAGTWGTYTAGRVVATTPTLGASGAAIELTEDTRPTLWCRIGGTVVLRVATLIVT